MPDVPPSALEEEPGPVDQAIVVEHDDDRNVDIDDGIVVKRGDGNVDIDDPILARLSPHQQTRVNNIRTLRAQMEDLLELYKYTIRVLRGLERKIIAMGR